MLLTPEYYGERLCIFNEKTAIISDFSSSLLGGITVETQQRAVCFTTGDSIAALPLRAVTDVWAVEMVVMRSRGDIGGFDFCCVMGWVLVIVGNPMGGLRLCSSGSSWACSVLVKCKSKVLVAQPCPTPVTPCTVARQSPHWVTPGPWGILTLLWSWGITAFLTQMPCCGGLASNPASCHCSPLFHRQFSPKEHRVGLSVMELTGWKTESLTGTRILEGEGNSLTYCEEIWKDPKCLFSLALPGHAHLHSAPSSPGDPPGRTHPGTPPPFHPFPQALSSFRLSSYFSNHFTCFLLLLLPFYCFIRFSSICLWTGKINCHLSAPTAWLPVIPSYLFAFPYSRLCSFVQHVFICGGYSSGLWAFSGRSFQHGANCYTSHWETPTWVSATRAVYRCLWSGALTCLRASGNYLRQGYCKTYQSKRNSLREDWAMENQEKSEKQGPKAWGLEEVAEEGREAGWPRMSSLNSTDPHPSTSGSCKANSLNPVGIISSWTGKFYFCGNM